MRSQYSLPIYTDEKFWTDTASWVGNVSKLHHSQQLSNEQIRSLKFGLYILKLRKLFTLTETYVRWTLNLPAFCSETAS